MATSKRTMEPFQIETIKEELSNKLNYSNLSGMNREDFKLFVFNLFIWLDFKKKEGLKKDDLLEYINKIHYEQSCFFEKNSIFEERLGIITDELISFCPSPFFWDIELSEYLNKWSMWFDKELIQ